eukprot:scaffold27884_cov65-Phaeocystis_antarctica.AAC.9
MLKYIQCSSSTDTEDGTNKRYGRTHRVQTSIIVENAERGVHSFGSHACSTTTALSLLQMNEGLPAGVVAASSFVSSASLSDQPKMSRSCARYLGSVALVETGTPCCATQRRETCAPLLLWLLPMPLTRSPVMSSELPSPSGE